MSIKIMSRVWELSSHKGSDLLLLLAIADNANDDGICWPGMSYLAEKVRMSERSIINIIRRLEQSGEIVAKHVRNSGNRYAVLTGMTKEQREKTTSKLLSENISLMPNNCKTEQDKVKDFHLISETASAVEPSITVNEPSIDTPTLPGIAAPTPKAKIPRELILAIATVTKTNLSLATNPQKAQVTQTARLLHEKVNADEKQVVAFAAWWYTNDWRGRKGQAPTAAQIRENWQVWRDSVKTATPGSGWQLPGGSTFYQEA